MKSIPAAINGSYLCPLCDVIVAKKGYFLIYFLDISNFSEKKEETVKISNDQTGFDCTLSHSTIFYIRIILLLHIIFTLFVFIAFNRTMAHYCAGVVTILVSKRSPVYSILIQQVIICFFLLPP